MQNKTKEVDKIKAVDILNVKEENKVEDKKVDVPEAKAKVTKNKGVVVEIKTNCKWCGAGKYTQTLVFCSEECKNSYLASKGLDY